MVRCEAEQDQSRLASSIAWTRGLSSRCKYRAGSSAGIPRAVSSWKIADSRNVGSINIIFVAMISLSRSNLTSLPEGEGESAEGSEGARRGLALSTAARGWVAARLLVSALRRQVFRAGHVDAL